MAQVTTERRPTGTQQQVYSELPHIAHCNTRHNKRPARERLRLIVRTALELHAHCNIFQVEITTLFFSQRFFVIQKFLQNLCTKMPSLDQPKSPNVRIGTLNDPKFFVLTNQLSFFLFSNVVFRLLFLFKTILIKSFRVTRH